jgi:quinol monooxygenase YgiN
MLVIIPRLKAKPGSAAELERVLGRVSFETHRETPPPIMYQVVRSQTDPNSFIIVEIFTNADALKRHSESSHLQQALPVIESLLAEPWTAEYVHILD